MKVGIFALRSYCFCEARGRPQYHTTIMSLPHPPISIWKLSLMMAKDRLSAKNKTEFSKDTSLSSFEKSNFGSTLEQFIQISKSWKKTKVILGIAPLFRFLIRAAWVQNNWLRKFTYLNEFWKWLVISNSVRSDVISWSNSVINGMMFGAWTVHVMAGHWTSSMQRFWTCFVMIIRHRFRNVWHWAWVVWKSWHWRGFWRWQIPLATSTSE